MSFTPRDAHPHAASAGSGLGLQHDPDGGCRLDFQKLLLPSATPTSSPPALSLLSFSPRPLMSTAAPPPALSRLRRSRKAHDREAAQPPATRVPSWVLLPPSHVGPAGPGISGKANSGGEQVTRFLGVFVFWQVHGTGGGGVRGRFSFFFLFRCQTNDENPAIGAREPGARLLGGR